MCFYSLRQSLLMTDWRILLDISIIAFGYSLLMGDTGIWDQCNSEKVAILTSSSSAFSDLVCVDVLVLTWPEAVCGACTKAADCLSAFYTQLRPESSAGVVVTLTNWSVAVFTNMADRQPEANTGLWLDCWFLRRISSYQSRGAVVGDVTVAKANVC